jgi:hypothetical protein
MDARKTLAALTASLLLAGTAATAQAKPATPEHQLAVAKKRIKAQQKAIRSRNATIKSLRADLAAKPKTITVPGPTITIPGPTVTVPASCPLPDGTFSNLTVSQAWDALPTLYGIIHGAESSQAWDANPSYNASRTDSTFDTFSSTSFYFSRWLDR